MLTICGRWGIRTPKYLNRDRIICYQLHHNAHIYISTFYNMDMRYFSFPICQRPIIKKPESFFGFGLFFYLDLSTKLKVLSWTYPFHIHNQHLLRMDSHPLLGFLGGMLNFVSSLNRFIVNIPKKTFFKYFYAKLQKKFHKKQVFFNSIDKNFK